MKKLCIMMCLVLFAVSVQASPFLVCDPQEGVDYYHILSADESLPVQVDAQLDGSLMVNVEYVQVGDTPIEVKACDDLWGCSAPTSFIIKRPSMHSAPASFKLVK